jgi:hypothetical protein
MAEWGKRSMSSDSSDSRLTHAQNIERYRRLLKTQLSDAERQLIERRIAEAHRAYETPTDRFVVRANIDHFLKALWDDELPPEKRAIITKLLIEEQNKLSHDLEQLQFAEDRALAGRKRLEQIRNKSNDPRSDPASRSQASRLLATMDETQRLLEEFCERLRRKVVCSDGI